MTVNTTEAGSLEKPRVRVNSSNSIVWEHSSHGLMTFACDTVTSDKASVRLSFLLAECKIKLVKLFVKFATVIPL